MSVEDLRRRLEGPEPLFLLDVRNREDFDTWRIEGRAPIPSVNVPYFEMLEEGGGDDVVGAVVSYVEKTLGPKIPKPGPVVAVCAIVFLGPMAAFGSMVFNGYKAPRPLVYGAVSGRISFRRELLEVRPLGRVWAIAEGSKHLFTFVGETDARQVLDLVQQYQADQLWRIGAADSAAFTFLLRTR